MSSTQVLGIVALSLALIAGSGTSMAQSQSDKTGLGGQAAGQDTVAGVPIGVIAGVGAVAIAIGVAVAASSSGESNNSSGTVATGTTTTTTTR